MHPLERALAAVPERALRIYQGALFTDSLKLLAEEKDRADPNWLAARVENMLLSNGAALSQMRSLHREADELLRRYRQLPEADESRITSFELSGLLTLERQIAQLEENEERFRKLLRAVREAKKQRTLISLSQLLNQFS